jgi:hypothetical protein
MPWQPQSGLAMTARSSAGVSRGERAWVIRKQLATELREISKASFAGSRDVKWDEMVALDVLATAH